MSQVLFGTGAERAQSGERAVDLARAWSHGCAAVAELGLTAHLTPVPADDPGAWRCVLRRDDRPVLGGDGSGKGATGAARVGAVFEALEHHLSRNLPPRHVRVIGAHEAAAGLADDAALALLAAGPDRPLACLPYRDLLDDAERALPVFLSSPDHVADHHADARAALGDTYDYAAARRYSLNSGWAAGTTPVEAAVHAINEIIERDAMSLLLIARFLARRPAPLHVVRPATLPDDLAALHRRAADLLGGPVHLVDMTTDLGVPAYWAHTPAPPGRAARVRGCGASLSARYAAERALTELIQVHSIATHEADPRAGRVPRTTDHPALHRCHLADLTAAGAVRPVAFTDTDAPATPREHLDVLLRCLDLAGYRAYGWPRHVTGHLAVLNVCVPGLERFMLVTDGVPVLPGRRGRDHRTRR
ncbi:ribosomal protein S12 methylthiotransferase accessory factor [Saccharothrix saharensis]|uniref:Ribosomal protein S12 methylthiotransferase accessory factor n=1 Tax=Saccharothrix saharensis TaxID=571190 RepID=A0A543JDT8_9PSEU|nr:YcaO-like family protein [Saccharothrix saharensis]TQM80956.1 ribosomal protein S12 methylthiotransferase accessory factor [Saccharothrix saharensis]